MLAACDWGRGGWGSFTFAVGLAVRVYLMTNRLSKRIVLEIDYVKRLAPLNPTGVSLRRKSVEWTHSERHQ